MSSQLSVVIELTTLCLIWGMLTMINKEKIRAKCEFWQLFWIFNIWYVRDVHRSKSWRLCKHCSPEAHMYSEAFIFLCEHNLVGSD